MLIFVTSSAGGKRAVAELCDTWTKKTKRTKCGTPIIKLGVTTFLSKKFGKVQRPLFDVVKWDEGADVTPGFGTSAADDPSEQIPF